MASREDAFMLALETTPIDGDERYRELALDTLRQTFGDGWALGPERQARAWSARRAGRAVSAYLVSAYGAVFPRHGAGPERFRSELLDLFSSPSPRDFEQGLDDPCR